MTSDSGISDFLENRWLE